MLISSENARRRKNHRHHNACPYQELAFLHFSQIHRLLKEHSPRVFVPLDYAKHAIKEQPKSICNTFSSQLLSISLASRLGCQRPLPHKHDRRLLSDLLKKGLNLMGFGISPPVSYWIESLGLFPYSNFLLLLWENP